MMKNLRALTASGIMWTGMAQFSTQIFQFLVIVVLARLLSPKDFGIVGLVAIIMGLINTANELGLSAAIIRRKDLNQTHLSTSLWASAGAGAVLCVLVILSSPFIAGFFREDLVRPVLIVSSMGLIIGSFSVVQRALLEKNLNFKSITLVEISAAFAAGIVSILLAFGGLGVWSLVLGSLCGIFITAAMLWRISPWRPDITFSYSHFRELFGFGSHVTGSQLLAYIAASTDYVIVGRLLGALSLGYYSLAYTIATIPLQKVSWIVMRVTFPAFSTLQDNDEALRKGYLRVVRYVSLITFPMLAGMFAVAPEFVAFFYGEKWIPMVLPLQILCLAGALKSVNSIVSTVQFSKGRADIQLKWTLISALVMPVAIIAGVKYGITGVAGAVTVMAVILFVIMQTITNRLIGLSAYAYLREILPAAAGSVILVAGVKVYQGAVLVYGMPLVYTLLSSVLIGIAVYVVLMRLLFNDLFNEMRLLIHEMRG